MSENNVKTKRPSWAVWMHVAGVSYALSVWLLVISVTMPIFYELIPVTAIVFTVATAAFIGGWGRYMHTKR